MKLIAISTFLVDLAKLKWEMNISSIWPHRDLFSIAKPGKYKLSFDIEYGTNTNPNWVRSNEIEIIIK